MTELDFPELVRALREVRDLADSRIVDECSREESEPFITIWEDANTCLKMLRNGYEQGR